MMPSNVISPRFEMAITQDLAVGFLEFDSFELRVVRLGPSRRTTNVRIVALVLRAVVFEQVGVRHQIKDHPEGDRPRERLGICDRDLQVHMAVVATEEALLDAHLFAVWRASRV